MKFIFPTARILSLALFAGITLLTPSVSQGQINYQGRLTDAVGAPLADGQYQIQFSLWTADTGGTEIWGPFILDGSTDTGHGPLADLVNSRFNVIIGGADTASRSLTASMTGTLTAYLEIKVGTDAPISPRQVILAAPRALTADVIPKVTPKASGVDITGDLDVSADLDVTGNATVAGLTASGTVNFTGPATIEQLGVNSRILTDSVQIWKTSPTGGALFKQGKAGAGGFNSTSADDNDLVLTASTGKLHLQHGNGDSAITIDSSNRVGIGTASPTKAKLVVSGSVNNDAKGGDSGMLSDAGVITYWLDTPAQDNSIYATKSIWAGENVIASSDERIKTVQGRSDSVSDLQSLLGIEITDYRYKDVYQKGNAPQKKVIAQQVEEVFPQAVSKQTDVVPDIYRRASIKDGWIALATDLKKGDRVKLISKDSEEIHEVLEVTKDTFRTDLNTEGNKVFVYGREVNDFRTVDYDAIAMLNVSATQELARRLEAQEALLAAKDAELAQLRDENDKLTRKVTVLDSRDQLFEARLIRLEKASTPGVELAGMKIQTAATE